MTVGCLVNDTVETRGSKNALVNIKASTVESDGAGFKHLPLVEKSLLASITHCVKSCEDVPWTRSESSVHGGEGYMVVTYINDDEPTKEHLSKTKVL